MFTRYLVRDCSNCHKKWRSNRADRGGYYRILYWRHIFAWITGDLALVKLKIQLFLLGMLEIFILAIAAVLTPITPPGARIK